MGGNKVGFLTGMMINRSSRCLKDFIRNGEIDSEYFLRKGLKELIRASEIIPGNVLINSEFDEALETYKEVMIDIGKQKDITEYDNACEELLKKLEEEVGKGLEKGRRKARKKEFRKVFNSNPSGGVTYYLNEPNKDLEDDFSVVKKGYSPV